MSERVQRIGGVLSIRSEVGRGTTIEARLPVVRGFLEPASHQHESKS